MKVREENCNIPLQIIQNFNKISMKVRRNKSAVFFFFKTLRLKRDERGREGKYLYIESLKSFGLLDIRMSPGFSATFSATIHG